MNPAIGRRIARWGDPLVRRDHGRSWRPDDNVFHQLNRGVRPILTCKRGRREIYIPNAHVRYDLVTSWLVVVEMNTENVLLDRARERVLGGIILAAVVALIPLEGRSEIGREVSMESRLADGEEFTTPIADLVDFGRDLLAANWTYQEGGGRPLTTGTGAPLRDSDDPLVFPRNFNRISGPDANSCAGCHNAPFGTVGGGGDIVANVFVLGQRFDFATFGHEDAIPGKSSVDERGDPVNLDTIGNSRATPGMFGSGFIEALARQLTADIRAIRDEIAPGGSAELVSKGISFGTLARLGDGTWDTSGVEGLPSPSLQTDGADAPPSLILMPFHQAGAVISLRQFTNNAFNHHHGIQTSERFGLDQDPDGDGYVNEMTRAEVTAASVFQAAMPIPGRVIPNDPEVEEAVLIGEAKFEEVGCAVCHVPNLPLDNSGWLFTEPNPYNPAGNLRPGEAPNFTVDLTDSSLPGPRLQPDSNGIVWVPAFTDFKLYDITSGSEDPNREHLNMHAAAGSDAFFEGNGQFLARRLWDVGNKPNYFHHGKYSTMRSSIIAHSGDAEASRLAFEGLSDYERSCVIEFLKTLRVLDPDAESLVVDEEGNPKVWPPNRLLSIGQQGGRVEVTWQGSSAVGLPRTYQLQRCEDLNNPVWTDIGSATQSTSHSDDSNGVQGYYRVVLLNQ